MSTVTKQAISSIMKNKKNVAAFSKVLGKRSLEEMYESLGTILYSGTSTKEAMKQIKEGKIGWKHSHFDEVRSRIDERDEFLVNPFEVEEGVLECPKCFGKKTFSYQKQSRSSDETMSTYAHCMNCMNKWVYSG